jgi:polyphosphate kinase 2 (PPK2 family)
MKRKAYEKEMAKLQVQLCHLQEWVKANKLRVIVLFEGRDAAGKGGTIKAITEKVSPRVFRVAALPAPSDREKTQLFFQRYMQYFPAAGEIVIFDRSWYNRAGVEYVMGFCTPAEHERFLLLCPPDGEIHHRGRHHPDQALARGRDGRAGAPLQGQN